MNVIWSGPRNEKRRCPADCPAIRQRNEKEKIEAGFSSLKAIFFAQVTFYGKCIQQNCLLWRTWVMNWAGEDSARNDIEKLRFFPASMFFFFIFASSLGGGRLNTVIVDSVENSFCTVSQ
jgi:hypothetical protein